MTSSFEVVGLDHVNVTAPEDLEDEVLDWYATCLGLERMAKPTGTRPQGAWFRMGHGELHVSRDEQNPHRTAHFGIVVSDFDAAIQRLRASGCHIEQASPIPGRRRFFTRDPAGNRVEVVAFESVEG